MRYVPNLIPDKSKVLPDYFKGDIYKPTKNNPTIDALMWILGVIFFLTALFFLKHPIAFAIFALIGFILIPPGHNWFENKFRFRLTPIIKTVAVFVLFIGSLPLSSHYIEIDKEEAYQQKLLDEKIAKEKAIADEKERQRKDSLSFHIEKSNQLRDQHKFDKANKQLQFALAFANTQTEKDRVELETVGIIKARAFALVKAGKYQTAMSEINRLLISYPTNPELLYNRAICFSKTGKIQEAVNDLKSLLQSGDAEAIKLYDKINPIKKRVSYYITRCCDGSISHSKNSGACSHHGGVCDWNEPVYEEYRKYQ